MVHTDISSNSLYTVAVRGSLIYNAWKKIEKINNLKAIPACVRKQHLVSYI